MKYLSLLLVIALVSAGNGNNNGRNGGNNGGNNKRNKNKDNGGTVDSCDKQSECLKTTITQEGDEYKICIWWDSSLNNCGKGKMDSISHVCYGERESEKKEGCNSGEENKICRKVPCDQYASFGLKDGSDCKPNEDGSYIAAYGFSQIEGIICKSGTQGGMCGGGAKKDCVWMIAAPKCENTLIPTTTDSPDGTIPGGPGTTRDNLDTTTFSPCIRDTDVGDVCLQQIEEEVCDGAFEDQADGCVWVDGFCTRACGYYDGNECANQCGCAFVAENCIEMDFLDSASNARMRVDEYVIEDEYDAVGDDGENENNGRWIDGVDNMYLFIGIGVIGFLLIVFVALIGCKLMKKKEYVEMEDAQEQEIQMNEIEVDGVESMIATR